jgi:hypothetical protein
MLLTSYHQESDVKPRKDVFASKQFLTEKFHCFPNKGKQTFHASSGLKICFSLRLHETIFILKMKMQ